MITMLLLFCVGAVCFVPEGSLAEEANQTAESAPSKPLLSEFGIKDFQNADNRVVWTHAAPYDKGANGFQIEVSEVKSGKVVSEKELSDTFDAKRNVLYRYRIRYYKGGYGTEQKIYGEYSDYRYFCASTLSGKRGSKGFELKWKKLSHVKGYDCYVKSTNAGKRRSSGTMTTSTFPAKKLSAEGFKKVKSLGKKSTSLLVSKVSGKKLNWKNYYYIIVRPKFYVGGKQVVNDLDSWVYK